MIQQGRSGATGAFAAESTTPQQPGLRWEVRWESSLVPHEHADLAALLGAAFPRTAALGGGRSWVGARPELRVVARCGPRPVAHAGVIRRFLRAPSRDTSVLVGDVGLVAVAPERRGHRLGVALMDAVATALADLGLPYGFLTCGDDVRAFYRRSGWTALTDQPLRSIDIHHHVEDSRRNGMVLPVLRPLADWPSGPLQRDGQEI